MLLFPARWAAPVLAATAALLCVSSAHAATASPAAAPPLVSHAVAAVPSSPARAEECNLVTEMNRFVDLGIHRFAAPDQRPTLLRFTRAVFLGKVAKPTATNSSPQLPHITQVLNSSTAANNFREYNFTLHTSTLENSIYANGEDADDVCDHLVSDGNTAGAWYAANKQRCEQNMRACGTATNLPPDLRRKLSGAFVGLLRIIHSFSTPPEPYSHVEALFGGGGSLFGQQVVKACKETTASLGSYTTWGVTPGVREFASLLVH